MTNLEIFSIIKARAIPKPQGNLSGIIDGSIQTLEIPSVSSIRDYAFYYCSSLTSVTIPDSITSIGNSAFSHCTSLTSIEIPNSVTGIGKLAFSRCTSLMDVTIPDSVIWIGGSAFEYCSSLMDVTIPDSVIWIGGSAFEYCSSLENVTFEEGFQCNGLNLSASTKFSVDTMIAMFNALADLTGQQAKTLTLGSTNLAKLTDEQKAIATQKNWTLA